MSKNKYLDIEDFYNKDMRSLLREWYVQDKMSSYEICEKIRKETNVVFSDRQLRRWLNKFGFCRTRAQSLRNRVITGRMDYQKRKPMNKRFIDYTKRDYEKRGELWAAHLKDFMVATLYNNKRFAAQIGCSDTSVIRWKYRRGKIGKGFQKKILNFFGASQEELFSSKKGEVVPRLGPGSPGSNVKGRLIGLGWRYFQPSIKSILYKQTKKTIQEVAKALGLEATRPHVSNAFNNKKLVSPQHQIVIAKIFEMPTKRIFVEPDTVALSKLDAVPRH